MRLGKSLPMAGAPRRWRPLFLVIVLAVAVAFSLDVAVADWQTNWPWGCSTTKNFTMDSKYLLNLRNLVIDLASRAVSNGGFSTGSAGEPPDKVFGLMMCYVDRDWAECVNCLGSMFTGREQSCPFTKGMNGYYDVCLLRYSDEPFFSVADLTTAFYMCNESFVDDAVAMNSTRWKLMTRLATEAAYSPLRFSNGTLPYMGSQVMYGVAQCTRDLNASDCIRCLSSYTSQLPSNLSNNIAGGLKGYSCYLKYQIGEALGITLPPAPSQPPPSSPQPPGERSPPPTQPAPPPSSRKMKTTLVTAISASSGVSFLIIVSLLIWWRLWQKKGNLLDDDELIMEDDFEKEAGPKRFPYKELVNATDSFSDEKKLGEGGFGSVYRGFLKESNLEVAIKRVSKGSKHGKKEYISEVRIISRLRHRNLVQLIGWCHAGGELLLIYELIPNGSLDTHLHDADNILPWPARLEIVLGLGSALLYLHQEWEQCVLHRDIKPSNIMLDAGAKLENLANGFSEDLGIS